MNPAIEELLGGPQQFILEGDHEEEMKPKEFLAIRSELGWTHRKLCRWLGVTEQMVAGYEAGRFPIPLGRANHMRLTALCLTKRR